MSKELPKFVNEDEERGFWSENDYTETSTGTTPAESFCPG